MSDDDYEALPETSTVSTHMLAGAAAGIMEHCVMYPVDCVKTRMQCLVPDPKANYRSLADAFYRIVRYEGIGNTLRGINALVVGAGPAHAMYFACYEKLKTLLHGGASKNNALAPLANGAAGCFATVLHDAVMNPADVVKQRMQVYNSPYKGCMDCFRTVYRTEGGIAFYRSFTTQLAMNIPFQSIHFVMYELCQDLLNKDREYNPVSHMVSGGLAGAMAAAVTTPLDVCKTLLNTQEKCALTKHNAIDGMAQAFRTVYEFRGFPGFFRGVNARIVYQMPSTALSWSVYEFFKYFITQRQTIEEHYIDFDQPLKARVGSVSAAET
ncbi:unnamed protein product [Owenia fusiformis]|uniref:Uncharacterized protein n=1 Tax=Owenia fusiformis TaxID=6347 RepID=A0A8J1T6J1_OWEFU|nr:unnamed protein product [Owenia fusiformis]